jgi:hypothetical protein
VCSGLICKNYTILEKLATDKHSSLLQKLINYRQKSFVTLALALAGVNVLNAILINVILVSVILLSVIVMNVPGASVM